MSTEGETVDEALSRDLSSLEKLSSSQMESFLRLLLTFLIDSKSSNFQKNLSQFAEEQNMSGNALKSLVRAALLFLQRGVRSGWTSSQLQSACSSMKLSESTTEVFLRCWKEQSSNLTSALLSKIVSANQLMDVDWTFGVTAATDDSDQVGKTFLQMKLTVDQGDSIGPRDLYMELSLEQFYHFMAQMEKAKAYLDFVAA